MLKLHPSGFPPPAYLARFESTLPPPSTLSADEAQLRALALSAFARGDMETAAGFLAFAEGLHDDAAGWPSPFRLAVETLQGVMHGMGSVPPGTPSPEECARHARRPAPPTGEEEGAA